MAERIEELKKDLVELQSLENQAIRQKVKDILSLECRKISTEIIKLQEQLPINNASVSSTTPSSASKRYQVKLNNYAWDQSTKFVKFYVTLPKIQTISQDNVKCNFTSKSFELNVVDLENKDYIFTINNLLYAIDPATSTWKIKTDMVLINAAKVAQQQHWAYVTELEKKVSDQKAQKLKPDDSMDPNDGLMSIMKNMYEQGDDEMKRTIAKAWSESQNKTGLPN